MTANDLYDYEEEFWFPADPMMNSFRITMTPSRSLLRVPANFKLLRGRENEKDAYVEMLFRKRGAYYRTIHRFIPSGGASSYMDVKSFKLVARKEYDAENSKFNYDFYNTTEKAYSEFAILRSYNAYSA